MQKKNVESFSKKCFSADFSIFFNLVLLFILFTMIDYRSLIALTNVYYFNIYLLTLVWFIKRNTPLLNIMFRKKIKC